MLIPAAGAVRQAKSRNGGAEADAYAVGSHAVPEGGGCNAEPLNPEPMMRGSLKLDAHPVAWETVKPHSREGD